MECRIFLRWIGMLLIGGGVVTFPLLGQTPEREYVIGVGDQLDIQAYSQGQLIQNFSTKAEVRLDGMITLPSLLGDRKVAGLKKSTLTTLLESKEFFGKYLKEPRVMITPLRMAPTIRIFVSGLVQSEQEVPRETKIGLLLRELVANVPQEELNPTAIRIRTVEKEEFPPDPNLTLQWGDEIVLPSREKPTPTPLARTTTNQIPAKFTSQEYPQFLEILKAYPADGEILQSKVDIQGDTIFLKLDELPPEKYQALHPDVIAALQPYQMASGEAQAQLAPEAILLGIRVKLTVKDLYEAFFSLPDDTGGRSIKRFLPGDVVQPGATPTEDIILSKIQTDPNQVILKQGDLEDIRLPPTRFSELTLVGIITRDGEPEAILSGIASGTSTKLGQRKRFKTNDMVEPEVVLEGISERDKYIVLRKGQEQQIVFLYDARQPASSSSAASEPVTPENLSPGMPALSGEPSSLLRQAIEQKLPAELKALNTLSKIFFATPILP